MLRRTGLLARRWIDGPRVHLLPLKNEGRFDVLHSLQLRERAQDEVAEVLRISSGHVQQKVDATPPGGTAPQPPDDLEPAVSLGTVDSLIQHPASLTHGVVDGEARNRSGITPGMLRLSVGLEDPDDLWCDLSTAIDAASPARSSHEC